MTQNTETLWQIGQSGKGGQEFLQAGGWQAEFTYIVGSDDDPINQPRMPSLLLVPGLKTKPKRGRKELFATDKLNIQFSLPQSYSDGELTLFYNFYGSETDTLFVDGEPITELVGAGERKLNRTQTPLPALSAGKHTLTLTTAGGVGGKHSIDYLKLDGVVAAKTPEKTQETMTKPKETMAKATTPEPEVTVDVPKKSYVPTSQTGLQDYGYWYDYCRKQAKKTEKDHKPFRRGRIWA
ncbi:cyanobactin biosynthesis PatC/TenC/TruC family protein [Crocosphaera sp. XPORK-15E]|uniref:cyanobactin biosynthesis PatC/TenC/TruC family protein n=1 Tax=Crocosphaera sp. XPORK-15E TaxID=3110247 RepID=UPI002B1F5B4C|nr:cyanobactin biosynthesis PatC/TenC/TruC family protein [Crocosphaera sp. XPORK-15E]MEA5536884.1 cyanobactin biosynthesis PatC/TenC/TruC family protein [Crocosphaera sp. XPORK-15E]